MFKKAILAGMCIGISSLLYLNISNKIIGAFLFSLGLITIMLFQYKLYTGVVGYTETTRDIKNDIIIFIGNLIGTLPFVLFYKSDFILFWENKISNNLLLVFCNAFICGILIYIAVESYKRTNKFLITILCIATFILCGAEHSIADLAYMFLARNFSWYNILFITVVALGNAAGAIFFNKMNEEKKLVI